MIESIWDMLLKVHSGCPGNIFFSKLNICKGSRPACNNIQIHEKWELKRQMFSSAVCSLSPSAPKPLLQLQSPLPTDPNGKIQSRLTFYNRFTNPLKVPDLALPLFLVHHKNKCTEKPLRSSLCWRTSFPYFFFFFFDSHFTSYYFSWSCCSGDNCTPAHWKPLLLITYLHGWERFM